jgi:SAM-dependent methyltransferase
VIKSSPVNAITSNVPRPGEYRFGPRKSNIHQFRVGEQIDFQPADATAIPFSDGAFDTVVCQFGVMFFADKDKSYREVHRVLDHGGRYVFSVWDRYGRHGRIADEIVGRFFPVDPPQFYRTPSSYYKIDPIKGYRQLGGTRACVEAWE